MTVPYTHCHTEQMVEKTVEEKTGAGGKALEDMDLDELDELEDEEDERVLQQFRCVCVCVREREFISLASTYTVVDRGVWLRYWLHRARPSLDQ